MSESLLSIKASLALKREGPAGLAASMEEVGLLVPSNPLQNIRLLSGRAFQLKIIGLDENHRKIFEKIYDSDSFGNFAIKIPKEKSWLPIKFLELYELISHPGVEIHLGYFLPMEIQRPSKIIISDFDKTLVDTRHHTGKDVFDALTRPLQYFPTVEKSVAIYKGFIEKKFQPFILSASPHFFENSIRDWLYQNKIYTAVLFLKDYRHVLSLFEGQLRPKDLKIQGLYKLNHLLDILAMTGIPDELVLMGDNFESDPLIYLTLALFMSTPIEPWKLWHLIQTLESFKLSKRQDTIFLSKLFQLKNALKIYYQSSASVPKISIYIRKKGNEEKLKLPSFLEEVAPILTFYDGR
ncbi:MAG: hypothetical protein HYV97_08575 [Bdellovibrio sp.]|nr:hypothetical protein [Bdellovibrio sp.]